MTKILFLVHHRKNWSTNI